MNHFIKISMLAAIIFISGLLSCGTDKNPVISSTEFTVENFPHEIGTVWEYEFTDKLNSTTDTLFVRIHDTTRITDDSNLVYLVISEGRYNSVTEVDTTYWQINSDTVTYYKYESESYKIDRIIIFPLEVGNSWETGTFPFDSNTVFEKNSKIVLGKTYNNAYQINRTGGALNDYINDVYWCVPDIGFIQLNLNRFSLGPDKDETWNLISFYEPDSFKLSDFPMQVDANWTYKVYNNLVDCINCYDSVSVIIMDSIMDRGGIIRESWLFDYPNQERLIDITFEENKVFINWFHYPVRFSLDFPLTVGKKWQDGDFFYSTLQVIGQHTITTEAGTFEDAFCLKGESGGFEEFSSYTLWLAKGYGIVQIVYNSFSIESYNDMTWVLQTYEPEKPFDSFTIDKFPNYDGMMWTYEVSDNLSYDIDTLLVQVAESSTVAIWNYWNSDTSWSEIVSTKESILKFFKAEEPDKLYKSIHFPIEVGNSWYTDSLGNYSWVNSLFGTTVPVGYLFPCYNIQSSFYCGSNCNNSQSEVLSPQVGIVLKNIINSELGINETWRLIDYTNP